jgi:hypothetical protein
MRQCVVCAVSAVSVLYPSADTGKSSEVGSVVLKMSGTVVKTERFYNCIYCIYFYRRRRRRIGGVLLGIQFGYGWLAGAATPGRYSRYSFRRFQEVTTLVTISLKTGSHRSVFEDLPVSASRYSVNTVYLPVSDHPHRPPICSDGWARTIETLDI